MGAEREGGGIEGGGRDRGRVQGREEGRGTNITFLLL